MNGEIGYIAIAEGPVVMGPTTDMTMQHLHQSTMVSPVHLALGAADPNMDPQTTGKFLKSALPVSHLHSTRVFHNYPPFSVFKLMSSFAGI